MLNFILNEFLPFSLHSLCWMQDAKSGRNIRLSKLCFDEGASLDCVFITNLGIEISSTYFIYFPPLFIHISTLKNPKNHFSTIDQGYPISEKSLEALVRFISSPLTFSSFHRSFPLSKSKNTKKKIASDFNLVTFLSVDSTSTCH